MKRTQAEVLDFIQETVDYLNGLIYQEGHIDINNRELWRRTLNSWRNQDWLDILKIIADLQDSHPEVFKDNHLDAFERSAEALQKYWLRHDRVLDTKTHKKTAWQSLMALREVWNSCQGVYLPNDPKQPKPKTQPINPLFDFNV